MTGNLHFELGFPLPQSRMLLAFGIMVRRCFQVEFGEKFQAQRRQKKAERELAKLEDGDSAGGQTKRTGR